MIVPDFTDKDFEDIRPYRDHEIHGVLNKIRQHPWILAALRRYFWPNLPLSLEKPVDTILCWYLGLRLLRIHSVDDFHVRFFRKTVLRWIEQRTIEELTYSNFENIHRDKGALYITNHRDIVIDSAFLCYGLMKIKMKTVEIAFGDNLLINPFVSDLIRINKGFLVKRNVPVKEQMAESMKLSNYIWFTLANKRSIWLAQKGGRAKDGNDRTNPAIIKMIYLSQVRGGQSLSEFVTACNIVPVSISYEYDPCDVIKAKETYQRRTTGEYIKNPREDLISILKGINEPKGRIHYSFGTPLAGEWKKPQDVAESIDKEVIKNYFAWPSNYAAYDLFTSTGKYADRYTPEDKEKFLRRYRNLNDDIKRTVFEIYARPILNKEELGFAV